MSAQFVNGPSWSGEVGVLHSYRPYLTVVVVIALLSTAGGAFDTDHLSVLHRLSLWLVVGGLIVCQAYILDAFVEARLKRVKNKGWISVSIVLFAVTFLMTLELHGLKYTPLLPKKPDPFLEFFVFLSVPVTAIAGAVIYFRRQLKLKTGQDTRQYSDGSVEEKLDASGTIAAAEGTEVAFNSWPSETVLYVKASDHYLDITTAAGHYFIKGRMVDAVHRLAAADGAQVHRSWWVAQSYIRRISREGRDLTIETSGGETIPIARSRVKALQKKGWVIDS